MRQDGRDGVGGLTGVWSYIRLTFSKLCTVLRGVGTSVFSFFWKLTGGCTCGMKPVTMHPGGLGWMEVEQVGKTCFWCGKRRR
jgi:hypothetical protein